jgi:DNA-binding transcriptional regulator LsrR (DeoR family)
MRKLTDKDKQTICTYYINGSSQGSIASVFYVSRRTIGRVLREAGFTSAQNIVSDRDMRMVELLWKYEIDLRTLRVLLKMAYPEVK